MDPRRFERKGVPEVIFAEHKSAEQLNQSVAQLLESAGYAIVSRVSPLQIEALRGSLPDVTVDYQDGARTAWLFLPGYRHRRTGGKIAILTAGSSDWPAAHEARIVAEAMGCEVDIVSDVGVAGIHRLFGPLRRLLDLGTDAIIVAAGMDGALPSVVAGLVPIPVIGLPTSVGYGHGGGGEAALMSMLQTCAPGLSVVNIDNAVGAGASAGLIANAIARARSGETEEHESF
jgi:NCAIR mutase (PurE)-related protein